MTAQDWLNELERLRKAATPGPWKHNIEPRRDGMGFIWPFSSIESEDAKAIEDEEENITDSITSADAAYIVAACNAVPRLVEMVKLAASLLECPYDDEKCYYDDDDTVSCAHCKAQRLYDLTEPKE